MVWHERLLASTQSAFARLVSLSMGIGLALFILIWPQYIAHDLDQLEHGSLSLLMAFMCLLFVHGVGFQFQSRAMQWAISPALLWPITASLFGVIVLGNK